MKTMHSACGIASSSVSGEREAQGMELLTPQQVSIRSTDQIYRESPMARLVAAGAMGLRFEGLARRHHRVTEP